MAAHAQITLILATPYGLITFPRIAEYVGCQSFSITTTTISTALGNRVTYSLSPAQAPAQGDPDVITPRANMIAEATFNLDADGLVTRANGTLMTSNTGVPATILPYFPAAYPQTSRFTDTLARTLAKPEIGSRHNSDPSLPNISLETRPNPVDINEVYLFLKIRRSIFHLRGITFNLGTFDFHTTMPEILAIRRIPLSMEFSPSTRTDHVTSEGIAVLVWLNNKPYVFVIDKHHNTVHSFVLPITDLLQLQNQDNPRKTMALARAIFYDADLKFTTSYVMGIADYALTFFHPFFIPLGITSLVHRTSRVPAINRPSCGDLLN
ncbi:MAG: hypothetical protein K1X29_03700 [Bdellovibrionales bacterium]|nr:hypothetical protein [Bdellovibrionales bacterium]